MDLISLVFKQPLTSLLLIFFGAGSTVLYFLYTGSTLKLKKDK